MFQTKRGLYQLDPKTGLFTIQNESSTPKRFLGSVDPDSEVYVGSEKLSHLEDVSSAYRVAVILSTLFVRGYTVGFTPEFRNGYRPFGIVCDPTDIILVGEGTLRVSDSLVTRIVEGNVPAELGSKIDRVYNQLVDEERGYRVAR